MEHRHRQRPAARVSCPAQGSTAAVCQSRRAGGAAVRCLAARCGGVQQGPCATAREARPWARAVRGHTVKCLAHRGTELHRAGYGSCPTAQPERGGRLLCARARLERRFLGQVHEHDARHERHALAVAHLRGAALRQPADPALLRALHVFGATSQRRLYHLARPVAATRTTAHRQPPASHAAHAPRSQASEPAPTPAWQVFGSGIGAGLPSVPPGTLSKTSFILRSSF